MIGPAEFETNVLYMMSIAMDLILRDCERITPGGWKREKKQIFTRYIETIKRAYFLQEQLMQDIYAVDEKKNFRNVPVWQEEANELARLILLYADRSSDVDAVEKIHAFLRSIPGEGICDEKLLDRFYLKSL